MAIHNWNSDAAGVMRYAFWASMPFLFALFWRLRTLPRWPVALLFGVVLVQAVCTAEAKRYNYVELSPLCKWIMQQHYCDDRLNTQQCTLPKRRLR